MRGELVGRERTKGGLLCGVSGAKADWLGADEVSFFFSFFFLFLRMV